MQAPRRSHPLRSGPAPPKYGSTPSSPNQTPTGVGSNVSATPSLAATPRRTPSAGPGNNVTPSIRRACSYHGASSAAQSSSDHTSAGGSYSVFAYTSDPPPTPAPESTRTSR